MGYFRSYLYGSISYAAGVGPVRSRERMIWFTDDPLGPGSSDVTASLVRTDPAPDRAIAAR